MKQKTISAKEFRARIARLHKTSGSADNARIWFAKLANVAPWTVARWMAGQRPFRGPALALLEHLEVSSNGKAK